MLVLLAVGCGSGSSRSPAASVGATGHGADQVWVFRPAHTPKDVVVFVHGLGEGELTPANHRPWIEHLVAGGSAVLYPRYEVSLGGRNAVLHILNGVQKGLARLGAGARRLPLVVIGYSRGGELVADYAAIAPAVGRAPAEVLSVFPGTSDPVDRQLDFRGIDGRTRLTIWLGDRDDVVDGAGGRQLLQRLQAAGFPPQNIALVVIHSRPGFIVNHLAPLQITRGAKAAFWARADRIVERARR